MTSVAMTLPSEEGEEPAAAAPLFSAAKATQPPPLVLRVRVCLPCAQLHRTDAPYDEQDERGPAETREASAGLAADLYARMRSSALSVAASGGALAKSAVHSYG